MAEDKIDSIVDKPAIEAELAYLAGKVQEAAENIKKWKSALVDIGTAKTPADLNTASSKAVEAQKATTKAVEETTAAIEKKAKAMKVLSLEEAKQQEQIKKTNAEIRQQAKELNASENSLDKLRAKLAQMTAQKNKLNIDSKEYKVAEQNVLELTNKIKQLEANSGDFRRNVGNYSGAVKTLETALQDVKKKMDDMSAGGNANAQVIDNLKKEYDLLNQMVESQAHGFVSMRQEIKQNQIAIEQLSMIYGEDSEIVRNLIKENGKLRDSFDDLKATQKALGSDTFYLDGLLQAGQALVGMYGAATAAASLFGGENEELQKNMQKMMAVMTLVQSVQAVVNALQKESAAVQLVLQIRTKALAAAQTLYAFATGGATVATNLLRVALISTGIGAILVLLGTAASAMTVFSSKTDDAAKSVSDIDGYINSLSDSFEMLNKNIERNSKLQSERAKASGKSEDDIYLIEQKSIQDQIDNLKAKDQLLEKEYNTGKKSASDLEKLAKERLSVQDKIADLEADRDGKSLERIQKLAEERKKFNEKEFQAAHQIEQLKLQFQADAYKKTADNDENIYVVRLDALNKFVDKQKAIIISEQNFLLSNDELTPKQREKIKVESELKLTQLTLDFSSQRKDILKKVAQEETDALSSIGINFETETDKTREKIIQNVKDSFSALLGNTNDQEYTDGLKKLSEGLKSGTITYEDYLKQKEALASEYNKRDINNSIAALETTISNLKEKGYDTIDLEKQLNEQKRKLYEIDVKNEADADAEKKRRKKRLYEDINKLAQEAFEFTKTVVMAGFENEKNAVQEQIDMVDKQKEAEIAAANASTLSAQEKADKIATINAVAQAKKEALERRQREIDQKKAIADRAFQIFNVIGNTAMAISKAVAEFPLTGGQPFAAIAAAIGALQVASILATPIPKYKHGTEDHKGGMAIVGDGGKREMAIMPDGSMFETPSRPTLMHLPAGTKVKPDAAAYMASLNDTAMKMTIQSGGRDMKPELFDAAHFKSLEMKLDNVANAINAKPVAKIINTHSGIKYQAESMKGYIEYINKYFES